MISRRQALAAGLSPRQIHWRLATGEWERVHEGVYRLAAVAPTTEQRTLGACLATGGVVSHRSAALLHALDVAPPPQPEITASLHRPLEGVTVHQTRRLPPTQLALIEPFVVTTPARTLLDLAGVLTPFHLEAALDSALRTDALTLDRLQRCLDAHGARGWAGAARLRQLIDDRRSYGITRSRLELRLWHRFAGADVPTPVRNHVVRDEHGRVIAEIDLAWPPFLVGVEGQSYEHHFGRHAWRRDQVRHNRLTALGWIIFPATSEEAGRRFPMLLAQVRQALNRAT